MTALTFCPISAARSSCSGVAFPPWLFSIRSFVVCRMSLGSMRWLASTPTTVLITIRTTSAIPQVGRSAIDRKVLTGATMTPISRPKPESSRTAMAATSVLRRGAARGGS